MQLRVVESKGSYSRPYFLEDERGRVVAHVKGDQLSPNGLSIGEAERFARQLADAWNQFYGTGKPVRQISPLRDEVIDWAKRNASGMRDPEGIFVAGTPETWETLVRELEGE